ncbi:STAS domain-containing protein [Streptomyces swartbergensis]|uniref:STAS domain-containing protein n=1 Tax=Streptomyces swartbergensis TaxID=487165 RepID=A0A243S9D0_9ACTN|nr:hypothetical protein CA983_05075 [Streptomyces swartbergensis]
MDFLDSSGLNELLRLSKQTARGGGFLVLAGAPPRMRQIMSLTGADTVLPVYARAAVALGESSWRAPSTAPAAACSPKTSAVVGSRTAAGTQFQQGSRFEPSVPSSSAPCC